MKNKDKYKIYQDGDGPMIQSDDLTVAMSNSVEFENPENRAEIQRLFVIMCDALNASQKGDT